MALCEINSDEKLLGESSVGIMKQLRYHVKWSEAERQWRDGGSNWELFSNHSYVGIKIWYIVVRPRHLSSDRWGERIAVISSTSNVSYLSKASDKAFTSLARDCNIVLARLYDS